MRPSEGLAPGSGLHLGYIFAPHRCKCVRTPAHQYSLKTLMGEAFMRISANWLEMAANANKLLLQKSKIEQP